MVVPVKCVRVMGPKDNKDISRDGILVYTVSHFDSWSRGLSPFFIGPCKLYGGYIAQRMENAWQFCKVYECHADFGENPTEEYWRWARQGWADNWAHRHPMGKGAVPLYSLWNGEYLNYIEARKKIYAPLYARAVKKTMAYHKLKELYETSGRTIYLWDFDGYNNKALGMSLVDVLNCPDKTMGHAFVLARMLEKNV